MVKRLFDTDEHADTIVGLLKEEFNAIGVSVPNDAIEKITGKSYNPQQLLTRYKNEKFPTIAVTVDLLTTGIDVPPICNIVFMRRVKSRILYEQMPGRATADAMTLAKKPSGFMTPFGSTKPWRITPK